MKKDEQPGTSRRLTGKQEDNLTHTLVTIAPDGGWGWVILAVSMWGCMCIDSISLGYGSIQESIVDEFKVSSVEASMVVSIFNFLVSILGPITAALANRYGFLALNVAGGLIGSIALLCCYWNKSYSGLFGLYAGGTGIGAAMICMVVMTCPGYWFEAKRSLAFGISNSSSGLSTLAIPSITLMIKDKYGWRWVLVFLSSMYFVAFLLGFLIKKPPMMLVEIEEATSEVGKKDRAMSVINVRGAGKKKVESRIQELSQHALLHAPAKSPYLVSSRLSVPSVIYTPEKSRFKRCWGKCSSCCTENELVSVERPLYKSDIFLASRTDFVAKKQNMTQTDYMMSVHRVTTVRDIEQQFHCTCCPEAIIRPLKEMLGLSLLKNIVFVFLLIDTMTYYSAIYVTYLYMARTNLRKGLPENIAILALQLFGITTAVTRILLGVVFHFLPNLPPHYFTSIYVIVGGACQIFMAFTTDHVATCVLGGLAGFFSGVYLPMRSILIVRYVGLDKLTNAMGMVFVFQAFGALAGAPTGEFLTNKFDDDYMMFYFSGTMYTLTGLLILPMESLHKLTQKKR